MKQYVINGGGMVGAAAALALAEQGHQVTLVDRNLRVPRPPGIYASPRLISITGCG